MDGIYEEAAAAGRLLTDTTQEPYRRITQVVDDLFGVTEQHGHLYRAVLQARATNPAVRQMWESDRASFEQVVAEMIDAERSAGRAVPGPDSAVLASVLLDLNDRNMERRVDEAPPDRAEHVAAVTSIWVRTVYGGNALPYPDPLRAAQEES